MYAVSNDPHDSDLSILFVFLPDSARNTGGVYGARTRNLRRDRAAL
jgi:hypothetical protein